MLRVRVRLTGRRQLHLRSTGEMPGSADDELALLMASLRSEMEERDRRIDLLQSLLLRKSEEREVLYQNYQEMLEQVNILRQLVSERLGLPDEPDAAVPAADVDSAPDAADAPPDAADPAVAGADAATHATDASPVFWERWVQRVEVEVSTSRARLDESLQRGKARAQDSLIQWREGWSRGLDELVSGMSSKAPGAPAAPPGAEPTERGSPQSA